MFGLLLWYDVGSPKRPNTLFLPRDMYILFSGHCCIAPRVAWFFSRQAVFTARKRFLLDGVVSCWWCSSVFGILRTLASSHSPPCLDEANRYKIACSRSDCWLTWENSRFLTCFLDISRFILRSTRTKIIWKGRKIGLSMQNVSRFIVCLFVILSLLK